MSGIPCGLDVSKLLNAKVLHFMSQHYHSAVVPVLNRNIAFAWGCFSIFFAGAARPPMRD
ncbi:MAG TPA: hypothetical protein VJT13_22155 [Xanthobacteraceae bacterium]|nr:hypothetical protein [Xanthobacteraceae bacterium]